LWANDLAAVIARGERAIACGASDGLRGEIRARQAEAHRWLGAHAEAERCGREAMELLPSGSPLWFCVASDLAVLANGDRGRELIAKMGEEVALRDVALRQTSDAALSAIAQAAYTLLQVGAHKAAEPLLDRLSSVELGEARPLAAGHVRAASGARL